MSNPESFLTRWSRRKHAANVAAEEGTPSSPSSAPARPQDIESGPQDIEPRLQDMEREPAAETECREATPPCPTPSVADPPFDPLSLPPIETIGPDTDIRGFLKPGVPPELTRAALRRAWAADPKIRDHVSPADYDWDFNAPGAMAGFGPIEMTEELRRVAADIIGQMSRPDQADTRTDQTSGEADRSRPSDPPGLTSAQTVMREADQAAPAENAPAVDPPSQGSSPPENRKTSI
jgi:hypothetical protein